MQRILQFLQCLHSNSLFASSFAGQLITVEKSSEYKQFDYQLNYLFNLNPCLLLYKKWLVEELDNICIKIMWLIYDLFCVVSLTAIFLQTAASLVSFITQTSDIHRSWTQHQEQPLQSLQQYIFV